MILSHFSSTPIKEYYGCMQIGEGGFGKPSGLWVSVDGADDWPSWCKAEQFRDTDKQLHYRVELNPGSNILIISSYDDIKAFGRKYAKKGAETWERGYINWDRFAGEYSGLIITPYCWDARLCPDCFWYYGWDCASGCLFGQDAVKSLTLLNGAPAEKASRRRIELA